MFLNHNGASLYVESHGSLSNPAVLLIHAGVATLRMWDTAVPWLAHDHFVIRYDARGFGRTTSDTSKFSNHEDVLAVLDHFGIAPGQLAPNGWRALAGFVVLSHFAAVPPSLPVFRHFFALCAFQQKLYSFRGKDAAGAGLLFSPMKATNAGWKKEFFFLSSSAPWPCPVQWGKAFRSANSDPALTDLEKAVASSLLRARGDSPIDLTTYLHGSSMAEAKIIRAPSPPTDRGALVNTPEHFTAGSGQVTVKSDPDSDVSPRVPSSFGKNKRKLPEHRTNGESSVYLSCPPGFSPHLRKARTSTSKHGKSAKQERQDDGDAAGTWKAARQRLQGIVTPARQREHAASRQADVVASSYVSLLQVNSISCLSTIRSIKRVPIRTLFVNLN
jgi:pimeloyl-ACP methyl ester carboxylesterase